MAVEVILGSSNAGSQSLTCGPQTYSQPSVTAAWSGGATSVDCTTGKLKFGAWDPASNFKMLVWDNSGNLIGTSDALNINPSGAVSTFTFSTPVTIVKGNVYRFGWVSDGSSNTRPYTYGSGGSVHRDDTATYASPANWTEAAEVSASLNIAGSLEAETAGGPSITGGTANPVHLSTGNTITGSGFGATQGAGTLVIGGQSQTVTAWSDVSITYTANRGVNLNDVAVNAVVTDNSAVASNSYALTGFDPPAGYSYVTLTSVNGTAAYRITAIADLAIGNQLEWDDADVVINNDATFDCDPSVIAFNVRVGVTTDGWGALAEQEVNGSSGGEVEYFHHRYRRFSYR